LSVQDAPEFEDWVAGQRAHWLGVVGELLDRLATLHVDEGDLGAAAGTLERWVALDPGEEGAWQRAPRGQWQLRRDGPAMGDGGPSR
jgi:DNA-binding SARP family transcriptional activator